MNDKVAEKNRATYRGDKNGRSGQEAERSSSEDSSDINEEEAPGGEEQDEQEEDVASNESQDSVPYFGSRENSINASDADREESRMM